MKPFTIDKFDGISQSPQTGFDVIANCDVDEDNCIKAGLKYHVSSRSSILNLTFTADESTNIITHADMTDSVTGLAGNDARAVQFSNTGGALPTGLSAGTTYWLVYISPTTSKIASTWQNAVNTTPVVVDFTTNGTGTHSMTSINMGTVKQIDTDGSRYFAVDSSGKVWVSNSNSFTWEYIFTKDTDLASVGLVVYKNYLLVFGQRFVDAIGDLTVSREDWVIIPGFVDTGATTSTANKDIILGRGNFQGFGETVFYTNLNTIGIIYQATGQVFNPASSPTYVSDTSAYTPRANPNCLEDDGLELVIGTTDGIERWDKISETSELPILVGKNISSISFGNNVIYAMAGESSTETLGLYETNGVSANLLVEIPKRIATAGTGKPRGMDVIKNKIYFLLTGTYSVYNSEQYNGLWSFNLVTRKLVLENVSTSGLYSTSMGCIFGVNSQVSKPLFFASGSEIGSITYKNEFYQLYDNYEPYFITPVYPLGRDDKEQTMMNVDYIFDRPLASGDKVRMSYRKSTQGSFSPIVPLSGVLDYEDVGAKGAALMPLGGIRSDIIQFKTEIKTFNTGTSLTSGPTIKQIIIS